MSETFNQMLTGGHPNSLGRTLEVVEIVLNHPERLEDLYQCYFDDDEVVRLRTSNAMKRVCLAHPDWIVPYIDRLLTEISQIDQPSTKWTLALLFAELETRMTADQKTVAMRVMQHNIETERDWIVLINSMKTLGAWSVDDDDLRQWLIGQSARLMDDSRKTVAKKARELHAQLIAKNS